LKAFPELRELSFTSGLLPTFPHHIFVGTMGTIGTMVTMGTMGTMRTMRVRVDRLGLAVRGHPRRGGNGGLG
jgi:hypothetical protein